MIFNAPQLQYFKEIDFENVPTKKPIMSFLSTFCTCKNKPPEFSCYYKFEPLLGQYIFDQTIITSIQYCPQFLFSIEVSTLLQDCRHNETLFSRHVGDSNPFFSTKYILMDQFKNISIYDSDFISNLSAYYRQHNGSL